MGKGSGFEREQCKAWSEWFSKGASPDFFWRTEGSGGRAKSRGKKIAERDPNAAKHLLKYSYGDMTFILPEGEPLIASILFEFKRGYSSGKRLDVNALTAVVQEAGRSSRKSTLNKKWITKYTNKIRTLLSKTKKAGSFSIIEHVDAKNKKSPSQLLTWWTNAEKEKLESGRSQVVLVLRRDGRNPVIFVEETFGRLLFKTFDSQGTPYGTIVCGSFNLFYFKLETMFENIKPETFLLLANKAKTSRIRKIKRRSK